MCTFLSISYKYDFYKGTIFYIFQIEFCVCCMYSTWHTVMDTCTYCFILLYYIVHVSGIKQKQTIAKKLCIKLN